MPDDKKEIVLISDGCSGQNRNSTLSNSLVNLAMIHKVTLMQKYLEKGHTQMEVDNMHSCIEKKVRNRVINVPADYVHACRIARREKPYKVKYLTFDFFKKYDEVKFYKSIRPGRNTVNQIRALKYETNGKISFKLRHPDPWENLNQRSQSLIPRPISEIQPLFKEKRKIKADKYQHLQILKQSLLSNYHAFYDTLAYE